MQEEEQMDWHEAEDTDYEDSQLDGEAPWEMAFERGAAIANDELDWDEDD